MCRPARNAVATLRRVPYANRQRRTSEKPPLHPSGGGGVLAIVRRHLRRCQRWEGRGRACGVCGFAGSSGGWPVGSPVSAAIVQIVLVPFDSCQHVDTAKYHGPGSSVRPIPFRLPCHRQRCSMTCYFVRNTLLFFFFLIRHTSPVALSSKT